MLFLPEPVKLGDEVWHIPGWLDYERQQTLVASARTWGLPPAGAHHPRMPNGSYMSVEMVGLGWHWSPYRYSQTADESTGERVKPFPKMLHELANKAMADTYGPGRESKANAAIVNRYFDGAKMGMHQDLEELASEPVISISVGASCTFRFGNSQNRNRPWTDVTLGSGDLFVFGGAERYAYHGVTKVLEDGPPLTDPGERFNITLRVVPE